MQKKYPAADVPNPLEVLRKAGYSYFRDPQSNEESFVLRLSGDFYPRFHLYVENGPNEVAFNLHLDQKKPSYGGSHAHAGEYDGSTIEKEMKRIDGWVKAQARSTSVAKSDQATGKTRDGLLTRIIKTFFDWV